MTHLVNSQIPPVERERCRDAFPCLTGISSLVPTSYPYFSHSSWTHFLAELDTFKMHNMSLTVTDEIKPNFDEPIDRRQS